ncbi:MAG TPA: lysylphosphatidylglycerol synthase transmembrane domain-containing protein [Gemmatimonadales bacterium]|nr:lysylphosphatidylglycerol synthase transmembrane domain-containing protein [Gemmatimonadales bacterium]
MKVWIKVAVSTTLLTLIFILLPWARVWQSLRQLPPLVWVGVWLGFGVGHALGVLKWRLFVNAGRASLGVIDAAQCYAAGLFANLCLPSIVGGDLLRMAMAGRISKRPEAVLWGGVLDRVTDVTGLAILVAIGGLLARHSLPGWGAQLLTVGIVLALFVAAIVLPFILRRPIAWWPRKLRRKVGRSLVAIRRLGRKPRTAFTGLAMSVIIQTNFVLLNAWLGHHIGVRVPLAVWFLVWPLAKVASLMPISLGGLAIREASLAALLAPFGVPLALGVLTSLLWQTVLIAGGLMGGLAYLVLNRRPKSHVDHPLKLARAATPHG